MQDTKSTETNLEHLYEFRLKQRPSKIENLKLLLKMNLEKHWFTAFQKYLLDNFVDIMSLHLVDVSPKTWWDLCQEICFNLLISNISKWPDNTRKTLQHFAGRFLKLPDFKVCLTIFGCYGLKVSKWLLLSFKNLWRNFEIIRRYLWICAHVV